MQAFLSGDNVISIQLKAEQQLCNNNITYKCVGVQFYPWYIHYGMICCYYIIILPYTFRVPLTMVDLPDDIFTVACALVNLTPPLVPLIKKSNNGKTEK